jgi:hypothetical protein
MATGNFQWRVSDHALPPPTQTPALYKVKTSLQLVYLLFNMPIIYHGKSSLFINWSYPIFIPIFVISVYF